MEQFRQNESGEMASSPLNATDQRFATDLYDESVRLAPFRLYHQLALKGLCLTRTAALRDVFVS